MLAAKSTVGIIFLICHSLIAHSQTEDYIVTVKNDTIYGDLQYRFSMPYTLFTDHGSIDINIKSVDSYCSAGHKTLARRRMLPGKKKYTFLSVAETGLINLYIVSSSTVGMYTGKTTMTFYAEKGDSPLVEIWTNKGLFGNDNKAQRDAMEALISDNPAVKQTFDTDTKYDAIDAQYYIHEYNKGTGDK